MIIAVDGPSGAGKSTLGKMLAKKLGLLYLDTGAMYRAVAFAVLEKDISNEREKIIEIAENSNIELVGEPESLQVLLNGQDISTLIRTSHSDDHSSSSSNNCLSFCMKFY